MIRVLDLDLTVFACITNYTVGNTAQLHTNQTVFPDAIHQIKQWEAQGDTIAFCSRSRFPGLCANLLAQHGIWLHQYFHVIQHTPQPATKRPHFRALQAHFGADRLRADGHYYDDDPRLCTEAKPYFRSVHQVDPSTGLQPSSTTHPKPFVATLQQIAHPHGYRLQTATNTRLVFAKL